jgi:PAS domain S-box-containing protein
VTAPDDHAKRTLEALRALVDRLPEGLLLHRNGRIVHANAPLLAILGYASVDELLGREPLELVAPAERPAAAARLARLDVHTPTSPSDTAFVARDGTEVVVEASAALLPVEAGVVVVVVVRDLRGRKRMEAQLLQIDRMASMGTLASGVAHEVNNPLGVTLANVGFALEELRGLDDDLEPLEGDGQPDLASRLALARARVREVVDALQEAREGIVRVRTLVRDLKMFSAVDEHERGPLDVRRVLESAINMAYPALQYRARIVKDYAEVPTVEGSEGRLAQVFLNLLLNAGEAIPEGEGARNEIRVVARTDMHGRCVVEISDTGRGIAPEDTRRIFDPFFTTKAASGTGLGLSICMSVVSAHGGSIAAEPAPGRGTTFRVTLPGVSDAALRSAPAPRPTSGPPLRRGRLLVVDDEPMMARAVERLFSVEHEVTTTTDPKAAVEMLRSGKRFDVILCDLMMPKMSGMDVYSEVVALDADQGRRMVFMTGGAFTPRIVSFLESVANPRVEKPIDRASLHAIIRAQMA